MDVICSTYGVKRAYLHAALDFAIKARVVQGLVFVLRPAISLDKVNLLTDARRYLAARLWEDSADLRRLGRARAAVRIARGVGAALSAADLQSCVATYPRKFDDDRVYSL